MTNETCDAIESTRDFLLFFFTHARDDNCVFSRPRCVSYIHARTHTHIYSLSLSLSLSFSLANKLIDKRRVIINARRRRRRSRSRSRRITWACRENPHALFEARGEGLCDTRAYPLSSRSFLSRRFPRATTTLTRLINAKNQSYKLVQRKDSSYGDPSERKTIARVHVEIQRRQRRNGGDGGSFEGTRGIRVAGNNQRRTQTVSVVSDRLARSPFRSIGFPQSRRVERCFTHVIGWKASVR